MRLLLLFQGLKEYVSPATNVKFSVPYFLCGTRCRWIRVQVRLQQVREDTHYGAYVFTSIATLPLKTTYGKVKVERKEVERETHR